MLIITSVAMHRNTGMNKYMKRIVRRYFIYMAPFVFGAAVYYLLVTHWINEQPTPGGPETVTSDSVFADDCAGINVCAAFRINQGQGLAILGELALNRSELAGWDSPDDLVLISTDRDVPLDMRNEALNGLVMRGYEHLVGLCLFIIDEPDYSDDYRAYAAQHLSVFFTHGTGRRSFPQIMIDLLSDDRLPGDVLRELVYGLSGRDDTRKFALEWLREQMELLEGRERYGDLLVRINEEYNGG